MTGWGRTLVEELVGGRTTTVYRDRPRSLDTLLRSGRPEDLVLVAGGHRLDRTEFSAVVLRAAGRLATCGVGQGDRVALFAANSAEWVIGFWAVIALDAVPVLMNGWWSRTEAEHAVALTRPTVVLRDNPRAGVLPHGVTRIDLQSVVWGFGHEDVDPARPAGIRTPAVAGPVRRRDEDELGVVLFTSGTSGMPKAVGLSQRAVIAAQQALLDVTRRLPSDPPPAARGIQLITAPLFHIGPIQSVLTAAVTGTTMVLLTGRFDAAAAAALIEHERVTGWGAVPTMVSRLLAHAETVPRDLTSLRSLGIGGAPIPPGLVEKVTEVLPSVRAPSRSYGLTEAAGTVSSGAPDGGDPVSGAAGRVLPTMQVRIAGADEPVPGEILVRGPSVMTAYLGQDEQPVDADGWLHTGDIGALTRDGRLRVVDRAKDVIIRGGENIAAGQIETVLRTHPAVLEAAVFGLADPDLGEIVAAAVVHRPGPAPRIEDLAEFARVRLSRFAVPARWFLRTEPLPTTSALKTDKRALRAEALALALALAGGPQ